MKRALFYIANTRMPNEKANGYQISQMCQAFSESLMDVTILYPDRVAEHGLENTTIQQYYGLRREIPAVALPTQDFIGATGNSRLFKRFGFLAFLWQTLTFGRNLVLFLKSTKVRGLPLLYLRDLNLTQWLLWNLPKPLRSQIVAEVHDLSTKPWRRRRQARILKRTLAVIALTQSMKEDLIALGVPATKILVAHDAVDLKQFDIGNDQKSSRRYLGWPEDRVIASFVGKFHTNGNEKGIPDIIRSATYLLDRYPALLFYFVGGPSGRVPSYLKLIHDLGLSPDRFVFQDKKPVSEVPYCLKASDILLMPHPKSLFYSRYVSPLKLFEYMSSKRPIVASNLPSILEVLTHGKNARLAEPGDPQSIANEIATLIENSELSIKLAENAYQDVQSKTWNQRAQSIQSFWEHEILCAASPVS